MLDQELEGQRSGYGMNMLRESQELNRKEVERDKPDDFRINKIKTVNSQGTKEIETGKVRTT
jgi:hypothetical protein